MIEPYKGLTPEELNFTCTLKELKELAAELKIEGRSKMNKIVLCLNIAEALDQLEETVEEVVEVVAEPVKPSNTLMKYEELKALNIKKGDKVSFRLDKLGKVHTGFVLATRNKTVSGGKFFNGRYWQKVGDVKQLYVQIQPDGLNFTIGETEFYELEVIR